MRLTDEQLRMLVAANPSDQELLEELRSRTRRAIIAKLPARTGRCPHGKRIIWDEKGAYSSGYPLHLNDEGRCEPGYCDQFKGIVNDPPTPERKRLLALLKTLKVARR